MGTEAKVDRLTLQRTQLSDPRVGLTPDILVLLTMELLTMELILIRRRQTALREKLKGSRKNSNANLVGQTSRLLIKWPSLNDVEVHIPAKLHRIQTPCPKLE
jgi:hypothetical protein